MNSSSESQAQKPTVEYLKRKYNFPFSVFNPILEIHEDRFSSIEEIQALLENILNNYDVKPIVCSENDDKLKNRWTLFEIKTSEDMGRWSLTSMACSISLLKINDHYVIDAHLLSGDRGRFRIFSDHLKNKISGEKIPKRTTFPFLPPDFCGSNKTTQDIIESSESLVETMITRDQPLKMIDSIITVMMNELIEITSKATPTELIAINKIVESVITILVNFIKHDVQKYPFIIEDPSRQNETRLSETAMRTQLAIQSLDILSQDIYYSDKLTHYPHLQNKLKTLHQYQPPHPEDHYLCAEMKRTCSILTPRLHHYKERLGFFFAKKATAAVLPRGLCMRYVPKDGHCLYHAIRIHLPDHPSVEDLRTQVANYVETNQQRYEQHIVGSFDTYVAGIRSNAWGDQIEIDALMHLFQRSIIIFHENGSPVTELHQGVFEAEPIPVLFDDINHYNAVTLSPNLPITMRQAIKETPKPLLSRVQDLNLVIATYLSISELAHFLGGRGHCEEYVRNQDGQQKPGPKNG